MIAPLLASPSSPRLAAPSAAPPASSASPDAPLPEEGKDLFGHVTDLVGMAAGCVTGTASAALHVMPGVSKGVHEALSDERGTRSDTTFQSTFIAQNMGLGIIGGSLAGGVLGAIGGGALAVAATHALERKAESTHAYEDMVQRIEDGVGRAVGPDGNVSVSTVVESGIIGGFEATRTGAQVGYGVGFDAVQKVGRGVRAVGRQAEWMAERVVVDPIEGLAEGLYEATRNVTGGLPGGAQLPAEPRNAERQGLRRLLGAVVGTPLGLVSAAHSAASGALAGAVTGLAHEGSNFSTFLQMAGSTVGQVATGVAVGAVAGGLPGALLGGLGGAIFANAWSRSDASEQISRRTDERVLRGINANPTDERFLEQFTHDLTEGSLTGAAFNAAEGFSHGVDAGAGITSGVIDGLKGFATAVTGQVPHPESDGSDESAESAPSQAEASPLRRLLRGCAGTVTGTLGAALSTVDGLAQGTGVGLEPGHEASARFHERLFTGVTVAAASAAGMLLGGGLLPALGGALLAATGAHVVHEINERTGASRHFAEGLTTAVRHAQRDNSYVTAEGERRNVYEVFRDGVEGGLTGAGAGLRGGFQEGFTVGAGVVDGVLDTVVGLAARVKARLS